MDRFNRGETLRDMCASFVPAFAPADTSLTTANFSTFLGTISALNSHLSTLRGSNSFLTNLAAGLTPKQQKRPRLYFEKGGFAEKFQAIKEAIKSQYGTQSAEYLAARVIKW